jgi:hypothetical protein
MKTKKLNLDDFIGCELLSNQKMNIRGGAYTPPPPMIEEDGGPKSGSTSNGDVKDPPPPLVFEMAIID